MRNSSDYFCCHIALAECLLLQLLEFDTVAVQSARDVSSHLYWWQEHTGCAYHCVRIANISSCLCSCISTDRWAKLDFCLLHITIKCRKFNNFWHTGGRSACLEHSARCDPAVLIARLFQTLTENSFIHSVLLLMLL